MKKLPDSELHAGVAIRSIVLTRGFVVVLMLVLGTSGFADEGQPRQEALPPDGSSTSQAGGLPSWSGLFNSGRRRAADASPFANVSSPEMIRLVQASDEDVVLDDSFSGQVDPPLATLATPDVVNQPYCSCPGGCPSSWSVSAEALYFTRESDPATLSNDFALDDFDFEGGTRLTIERRLDCLDAWALTYVGPFEFISEGEATGVSLNSALVPDGIDLSAFNGAVFHHQRRRSKLNSLELMRKCWGWDIIATSLGLRYLNLTDDFNFLSVDPAPGSEVGIFNLELDNHLIGPQIGLDLLYPQNRWTFGGRFKAGLYGNFVEGDLDVINAGVVQVDNDGTEGQLAAIVEAGVTLSYQVTPRVAIRAGYDAWYIYGVALTTDQVVSPLGVTTLSGIDSGNDTVVHGGSLGVVTVW